MADENKALQSNNAFLDKLQSSDPSLVKEANDTVNEFTRVKMREDGFARKILPPISISNDELDRQVDTDKCVKVVDKEPGSPAAISVPYGTSPLTRYIRGSRYRVMFNRIMTPRFTKDVAELRTYHMDIRQVLSDNAIKDMLAEEDTKFIYSAIAAVGGTPNGTVSETGSVQWNLSSAEISRDSLADSLKIMPSTPSRLEPAVALVNNITIKDVIKFRRDEAGGDLSQDMFLKGFSEQTIMGVKWIVTIKQDLVPNDNIYYFAEPKFLGKFYMMEDATMYMDRKAFMIEFFAYEEIGGAIGNVAAVARQTFNNGSSL